MAVRETSTGNGRGRGGGRRTRPTRQLREPDQISEPGIAGAAAQAVEILAPEAGLANLDPISFSKALARLSAEVARRPVQTARAFPRYGAGLGVAAMATAGR